MWLSESTGRMAIQQIKKAELLSWHSSSPMPPAFFDTSDVTLLLLNYLLSHFSDLSTNQTISNFRESGYPRCMCSKVRSVNGRHMKQGVTGLKHHGPCRNSTLCAIRSLSHIDCAGSAAATWRRTRRKIVPESLTAYQALPKVPGPQMSKHMAGLPRVHTYCISIKQEGDLQNLRSLNQTLPVTQICILPLTDPSLADRLVKSLSKAAVLLSNRYYRVSHESQTFIHLTISVRLDSRMVKAVNIGTPIIVYKIMLYSYIHPSFITFSLFSAPRKRPLTCLAIMSSMKYCVLVMISKCFVSSAWIPPAYPRTGDLFVHDADAFTALEPKP